MVSIAAVIAHELGVDENHVAAALQLLAEGNTVPFIARYRKEATGGLDDAALRHIEERSTYLRELEDRKQTILAAIEEQGKLTDDLKALIEATTTKARLEDLYLPFKKRRKTKADIARDAGLEPLLDAILDAPERNPEELAGNYITEGFADTDAVLAGARALFVDRVATDADLVGELRETMYTQGQVHAGVVEGQEQAGAKFKDYFDFSEPFTNLPAHRILALLRGEAEGVLQLQLDPGDEALYEGMIARRMDVDTHANPWLAKSVHWAWKTKLAVSSGVDVRMRLKERAEEDSLKVFATNLKDVLLAAPAGQKSVLGLDPGYRNGVKCAVVDSTGKVEATSIVYPHQPQNRWNEAVRELAGLAATYHAELIAVGNGTASRESEKLGREVADLIAQAGGAKPTTVVVSESGASVYSASELASKEFPDMDVSLRGAVSIARRLQDPLAELVKIDPKSIGVGQYQHDVNQQALARTLDGVVEDAVNAVGVDLNTASVPLLERVAGVTPTIASNIVAYRDENGTFESRSQLKKVPRLGPKAFEQCAGFLRINGGKDPLDASAVHPESYDVVRSMSTATNLSVAELIGNTRVLSQLDARDFANETVGVPTVVDILAELDKPGRDPRPEFVTATFHEGIEKISDLRPGMVLEGTITNVAAFGAFVDVGVHQDGLIHVSAMANHFVSDPHDVVKSGQVVKVKVTDVDVDRQRFGLTLRLDDDPAPTTQRGAGKQSRKQGKPGVKRQQRGNKNNNSGAGSMADALRRAGFGK
ncbi:Tex family protein [Corynebacterium renale]|uniref:S1 motif domain-containing protein n=1 Tax=Corynebacterium renale TaxID=1724 RepID=A0A2A9DP10_9CORY|nr:Tex family protein [Corynebacterium renale]PFG28487.1 uncharacterized protein ATK06_1598 [Corynebacterium renale]SQI26330.1 transcriptional accessory protein [Corynebacterium renale]